MTARRTLAAVAAVLAIIGLAPAAAPAAAGTNKTAVSASVGTLTGASAPVSYSVNRAAKQVAAVTYILNGAAPAAAPAPTAATKNSSGATFTVTAAAGANTLTVTVTLTDGGRTTSAPAQFTPGQAGCFESDEPDSYVVTDGTNPQLLEPGIAFGTYYVTGSLDADCRLTYVGQTSARALVWATDNDISGALALCLTVRGNTVKPSMGGPNLFFCF